MVSFLMDLLLETVLSIFDPASDCAIVATFSIVSAVITTVDVWMLAAISEPINQTVWGGLVIVVGLLCGALGLLVSYLHFTRNEFDRGFALLCLVVNGTALSLSVFALVAR
jgi:hypothetical protein